MEGDYDWRTDKQFKEWSAKILVNEFTFEYTLEFTGINKWEFESDDWQKIAKDIFTSLAKRWNANMKKEKEGKIVAYAAITLCYASVPYHLLKKGQTPITELLAQMIIRATFYEYNMDTSIKRTIPFPEEILIIKDENYKEDLQKGPMFPPAYEEWINALYNRASWWLSFLIYEREFRGDKPAVFKSNLISFESSIP